MASSKAMVTPSNSLQISLFLKFRSTSMTLSPVVVSGMPVCTMNMFMRGSDMVVATPSLKLAHPPWSEI